MTKQPTDMKSIYLPPQLQMGEQHWEHLDMLFQTKSKARFQIMCGALASLQNKPRISEMFAWFPCSSARARWRAVLPVQSANGVCGRHAAPSSRLAGTCLERYTCHSPSYERSSELQPWIISSRSKSLSFSFSPLHISLQNQPSSPCNYFNTCSGESKEMEYSSSLSLFNWRKFAKLGSELDIKRGAYASSQAERMPGWQALKGIVGRS